MEKASTEDRIRWAWQETLSRQPTEQEVQALSGLFERERNAFLQAPGHGKAMAGLILHPRTDIRRLHIKSTSSLDHHCQGSLQSPRNHYALLTQAIPNFASHHDKSIVQPVGSAAKPEVLLETKLFWAGACCSSCHGQTNYQGGLRIATLGISQRTRGGGVPQSSRQGQAGHFSVHGRRPFPS